jgi:hypothetical protein
MKTFISITFALILISGINSNAENKRKKNKQSIPNSGIIIGSITLENTRKMTTVYSFYYSNDSLRKKAEERKKRFFKNPNYNSDYSVFLDVYFRPYDFKLEDKFVYLFKIEKSADKYIFDKLQLTRHAATAFSTLENKIEYPFEIKEGEVKYFGDFIFNEKELELKLENSFSRDSASFHKKYPELNLSNAQ